MYNARVFGYVLLLSAILAAPAIANWDNNAEGTNTSPSAAVQTQQVVESVDIQGNRRLRDEDLLYYIKTRPGDVYDPAALERDLKELLSLNFFDKTATRVLTEDGVRGGVNVIFEVRELPIIRDLQFKGSKAISESDILKEFREKRVGISKEAGRYPHPARNACLQRLSECKSNGPGGRGLGDVHCHYIQYRPGLQVPHRSDRFRREPAF
jgi:outer membrane protein assembly factor BamA